MAMNVYPHYGRRAPWQQNLFGGDLDRDLQLFNDFAPYWRGNQLENVMGVGDMSSEVIDDSSKFGVSVDVSHFKPEELKVNLEGNLLTIEGNHETKTKNGFIQRSFTRKWTLPEDVNLSDIRSNLSPDGHLSIEAPKKESSMGRSIPILPGPPRKQEALKEKKDAAK